MLYPKGVSLLRSVGLRRLAGSVSWGWELMRRVFFSFHYARDIGRIGQIRNSWLTKGETSRFLDAAEWEAIKRSGDVAIMNWINNQLNGTSATAVLIGAETANRRWVKYEIAQSIRKRNGLLGIYIHSVKDFRTGATDIKGTSPFVKHFNFIPAGGQLDYPCCCLYDWINDNGQANLASWIETAARQAGRS